MRKIIILLLLSFIAFNSFAQHTGDSNKGFKNGKNARRGGCPKVYITVSSGLNNNTGIFGASIDVPVTKSISIEGGAGYSTWGIKSTIGAKYYFKPCHRGWAIGAGITHSTGLNNFEDNLETEYGYEDVVLNLHPLTNIYVGVYHFWNIGRKGHRFYTMLGWSIPLSNDFYDEPIGDPLSSASDEAIKLIAPGGLIGIIVGAGFSFGFGGR